MICHNQSILSLISLSSIMVSIALCFIFFMHFILLPLRVPMQLGTRLGDEGMKALAPELGKLTNLTCLNLGGRLCDNDRDYDTCLDHVVSFLV